MTKQVVSKVIKTERKTFSAEFSYGKYDKRVWKSGVGYKFVPIPYIGKVRANVTEKGTKISILFPREQETVTMNLTEAKELVSALNAIFESLPK